MEQPFASISAAALAFCMEWGALDRTKVADIDLKASPVLAHVRGTKRAWRDRHVPLVPELAWTLEHIRPALADKLPNARAFDATPEWRAIDEQRAAADALELRAIGEEEFGQHSIHDWRHTHTVALLRWGYSEQIAADHLGHKNTTLVRERYGRFKPTAYDYAKPKTDAPKAKKPKVAK
jgi:integrase